MRLRKELLDGLRSGGACHAAVSRCEVVPGSTADSYGEWLGEGKSAGMEYLKNHQEIRRDPRLLLEGAQSVISVAYSFHPEEWRDDKLPYIACYAYGDDYHEEIRRRLKEFAESHLGAAGWRVCVDTAPIMERYHALKSGLGIAGRNGAIIVEGAGSMVFLGEIITEIPPEQLAESVEEEKEYKVGCHGCGKCVKICPGGAIGEDGKIDARRCISYQSIEHKGAWDKVGEEVMSTPQGIRTLYGCDLCLRVCPHNAKEKLDDWLPKLSAFKLREGYDSLNKEGILGLGQEDFSRIFRKSAIKRAKHDGLMRNAMNLKG